MNWFQRYGIPGAAFWGLLILWIGAFHNDTIKEVIYDKDKATLIAAAAAGSFLPVGYFLSVIGQLIYHLVHGIGVDTRARKNEQPKTTEQLCDSKHEWEQEVASVRATIKHLRENGENKHTLKVDDIRFVSEWVSKRMGMVVMNLGLILAVPAAILLSLLLKLLLPWQFNWPWIWFAGVLSLFLLFFCYWSRSILTRQAVLVERTMIDCLGGPRATEKPKDE